MHIGVIVSMKKGLELFVYRELSVFTEQGHSISLFPTKYQRGLYNAKEAWAVQRWHPLAVIFSQPYFFLRSPFKYMSLFWEALTTRAIVDFMLAWYFAQKMKDVDVIYATFADRKLYIGYFCQKILQKPLAVTIH